MSATPGFTRVNEPFALPKGFDPTGTDIVRCVDPKMGYLNPNECLMYSFLIRLNGNLGGFCYVIWNGLARQMEDSLKKRVDAAVMFVSPTLLVDFTDKYVYRDTAAQKMVTRWQEYVAESSDGPRGAVGAKGAPPTCDGPKGFTGSPDDLTITFKVHGQKIVTQPHKGDFLVTQGDLVNTILGYKDGQLTVIGYDGKNELPQEVYRTLYLYYPTIKVNHIPYKGDFAEPASVWYKNDFRIFIEGPAKGVVFRREGGMSTILGMGPYLEPLDRDIAFYLKINFESGRFKIPEDKVKKCHLETVAYDPKDDQYDRLIPNRIVENGPLAGLLLHKKDNFYFMVESGSEYSSEVMALIREQYPMIVKY